jgi:hypothetical protein
VDFAYSVTVNKDTTLNQTKSNIMRIKVASAESIVFDHKKPLPDLVKLDVETFEPEVLQGFGSHFPNQAIFLIEVLSDAIAVKLSKFFPSDRYEFYNIDDKGNNFRKTPNLERSDLYNYLIVPKTSIIQFNSNHTRFPALLGG